MNITVYCGAALGNVPAYQQATIELGKWLAQHHHRLIYGGGKAGLMGLLADTVLSHGGEVIGVIPAFLREREVAHRARTEIILVNAMDEPQANM